VITDRDGSRVVLVDEGWWSCFTDERTLATPRCSLWTWIASRNLEDLLTGYGFSHVGGLAHIRPT
jgi:hypothetical protein